MNTTHMSDFHFAKIRELARVIECTPQDAHHESIALRNQATVGIMKRADLAENVNADLLAVLEQLNEAAAWSFNFAPDSPRKNFLALRLENAKNQIARAKGQA